MWNSTGDGGSATSVEVCYARSVAVSGSALGSSRMERSSDGGRIADGTPGLPARQNGRDARRSTDASLLPLQLPSACGRLFFDCCAARKLMCLVHAPPCPRGQEPIAHLHMPVRPAVAAATYKREFQPGPHSQLVEGGAQVVLPHLLAGEQYPGNIFVWLTTLPDEGRDLNFLGD
jgi:hypothetical protein